MEKSFTQRMDWLHTWFGLVLGWLAFALFLTGTIAVFWFEIQHWAQTELHGRKMLSLEDTVQYSVDYLEKIAPDSRRWAVTLPDLDRHPLLVLNWLDENDAQQFVRLVPDGSGTEVTTVTQGGRFFVDFHWTFNRPVHDLTGGTFQWTYMLSGAVGLAFLICTITGLVVHKKIFRNFFTFRRQAKSVQTRWLDAHNVLGVISWPFQFVIVLTGLAFYCYLYIPSGMQMASRYPEPPRAAVVGGGGPSMLWGRFTADAVGRVPGNIVAPGNPAPNVPVVDLFARAQAEMGTVSSFTVNNPHRDNATVRFGATRAPTHEITFTSDNMVFDGATGAVISPAGNTINAVQKVTNVLGGIHFAFFGGTAMRVLYFLCGLAGTIMIGAGLVMFMAKRRAKARSAAAARFYGFVDRMNVAAIGGALFACASYFWALRLLPQSLSDPSGGFPGVGVYAAIRAVPLDQAARSDLELYAFYFAWGVAGAHALLRAPHKAWFEQFAAVAALCIGLPVIGYLVPNSDIVSMIAAGDWKVVSVDLTAFGIGLALAGAAWKMRATRADVREGRAVATPVLSPAD
jgi:uncharacterized iron-regulated membrane protein